MIDAYILTEDGEPQKVLGILEWAAWCETKEHRVALTKIKPDISVSTIFVGLNHKTNGGPPLLWETMVFGGVDDGFCRRYASRADAVDGHATTCIFLQEGPPDGT